MRRELAFWAKPTAALMLPCCSQYSLLSISIWGGFMFNEQQQQQHGCQQQHGRWGKAELAGALWRKAFTAVRSCSSVYLTSPPVPCTTTQARGVPPSEQRGEGAKKVPKVNLNHPTQHRRQSLVWCFKLGDISSARRGEICHQSNTLLISDGNLFKNRPRASTSEYKQPPINLRLFQTL